MNFEPRPQNSFAEFIDTYFERCRAVCPKLRAMAGKWTFEDLIPGMSDFDTRFVFDNDVTAAEWIDMSMAVGRVHTQLAQQQPRWARILEHLPGLNLTSAEMTDPILYYPEFRQWTYYKGDEGVIESIRTCLAERPWGRRDEIFHLKKFSTFYGPYLRGIDPPVNLGKWENKYPLHSRFMHYFTPPVQSAVSLVKRAAVCGKFDSLRLARETFGNGEVIDMILDAVRRHYEVGEYYAEPRLTDIERTLENYLRDVYAALSDHVTLIEPDVKDSPQDLKARVAAIPIDPAESFYEGVKFCRFMKGRLLFYATEIAWFQTAWLIRNELGRMVQNFFQRPLVTFGLARFGDKLSAEEVTNRLRGGILTPKICDGVERFVKVASSPTPDGQEKNRARQVAEVFEPLQMMIETLSEELIKNL